MLNRPIVSDRPRRTRRSIWQRATVLASTRKLLGLTFPLKSALAFSAAAATRPIGRVVSRRLLTTPSRPHCSATRSDAMPSSKASDSESRAAEMLQQSSGSRGTASTLRHGAAGWMKRERSLRLRNLAASIWGEFCKR